MEPNTVLVGKLRLVARDSMARGAPEIYLRQQNTVAWQPAAASRFHKLCYQRFPPSAVCGGTISDSFSAKANNMVLWRKIYVRYDWGSMDCAAIIFLLRCGAISQYRHFEPHAFAVVQLPAVYHTVADVRAV